MSSSDSSIPLACALLIAFLRRLADVDFHMTQTSSFSYVLEGAGVSVRLPHSCVGCDTGLANNESLTRLDISHATLNKDDMAVMSIPSWSMVHCLSTDCFLFGNRI